MAGDTLVLPFVVCVPVQPPLATQDVAFVLDQVRVEPPPAVIEAGLAVNVTLGVALVDGVSKKIPLTMEL